MRQHPATLIGLWFLLASCIAPASAHAADPLPSWADNATKLAIMDFVQKVTREGSPDFVPAPERIATFDNDGTLWAEKPVPVELAFTVQRVKELAPQHPEWKIKQPFAGLLKGDLKAVQASGEQGIAELVAATHTGMTTEEFAREVQTWIASAKNPKTGKLNTRMVYRPMLELLDYLRANGFKVFIVSGGGVEFMRPWTEKVYGIPPEQVVGSNGKLRYELRDGTPVLAKLPTAELIDDQAGKPVGIQERIGRRPIAAFGNSDGDQQMLEWTMAGPGRRFALLVHHDDPKREFGYDRKDSMGKLDKAWDEAIARGWTVVSMKRDWKQIFPQ